MDEFGGIGHILPQDNELEQREKIFLNLFNKYSIDEDSDCDLMDDLASVEDDTHDNNDSDVSTVITSSGSESSFDMDDMTQTIMPVIKDLVNAWPEKGIRLHLKTVDPSVTVEEWLQSNQEHTTTKRQTRKTIVTEDNEKTIITTTKKTTTTTTTRKSCQYIRRNNAENEKTLVNEITNEDVFEEAESNRLDFPRPPKRNAVKSISNGIIPSINFEPSGKNQKLSPEMKETTESSTIDNTYYDSQIVGNVFDETFGSSSSDQQKSSKERCQPKRSMKTSTSNHSVLKHVILIHSPNARNLLGTKIDDTFMRVTRKDIEKQIDPQYHCFPDKSFKEDIIVPINQKIVYEPPTSKRTEKNNGDDSESDDILLTSFTETGHFLRLN